MGKQKRPLEGFRVLDFATMVAAPYCAGILGEFGAEVIKVEMPEMGDPLRAFGLRSGTGSSFNWLSEGRNKKSVTLDLRSEEGLKIARQLVSQADIVTENFRPGTLDRWGLGYSVMKAIKPDLVLVSVSAYGQYGPYKDLPGYARIAHGFSGLSYLTGDPEGKPAVPGASALADYISGVYAALGALLAIVARDRFGLGQRVDVSLYEGVFRMLDDLVPVYAKTGFVRNRLGPDSDSAAPHSNYETRDGHWVALACSNDKMFARLVAVMHRPELLARFAAVGERLKHRSEVNGIVADWMRRHTRQELMELCEKGNVPLGPINTIADIFTDAQVHARKNLERFEVEGEGEVTVAGVVPHLSETPGRIDSLGPRLGQHNDEVYSGLLGIPADEIARLQANGVI